MLTRSLALVALVLLVLASLVTGCGADTSAEHGQDHPTLLVATQPADRTYMGGVDSTLRVNDQGCFALDNEVLFAPYGSKVSDDGKGVIFPGYGEVRVGERITGAGGSTESVPTGGQKCLDPGPGPHYFETVDPLQ